MHRFYPF